MVDVTEKCHCNVYEPMKQLLFMFVITTQNLEEKLTLRIQLEGQVEDLWKQFHRGLKNYNKTL